MDNETKPHLKVFLCHASGDKPAVRNLYRRLVTNGIDAWLDQEKLLPGQDWREEIPRAVREADVVIVCLSNKSITKEGYIQTEIAFALDVAKEKPEGTIFIIPTRLEDCEVPDRLSRWQWVDLFSENGHEQLMRSLRLRADSIGAIFDNLQYPDKDKEERINHLYTEGSAALWVEDWDKACHRFTMVLQENPSHKQAARKLDEAKRQKHLSSLYSEALDAQKREDWTKVVEILENLSQEMSDYKDTTLLLKNARKNYQLVNLYDEARQLFQAEQWLAVVKILDRITTIAPDFPDSDNLLPDAQKKVAELNRRTELDGLYSRGIQEMDLGNWREARNCFQAIQSIELEFLETAKLLARVEAEIKKAEEKQWQEAQASNLYGQARDLVQARMWKDALKRIEEIRKLDVQFVDKDKIEQYAKEQATAEENQIERTNKLSPLYAQAVELLHGKNYQAALEKWQEIEAIDPKYVDPQNVKETSKTKLVQMSQPLPNNMERINPATIRLLIICLLLLIVGGVYWFSYKFNPNALGIDAQKGWQRTGVFVQQGDRVTIKVINGSWSGGTGYSTGDGIMGDCTGDSCAVLLANFPIDGLIAKIGDQPFGIGHSAWFTAPQAGEVLLRINDWDAGLGDNKGMLAVVVNVSH